MKIIYIIHNDWKKDQVKILASFGINVEVGFNRIDVEDGPLYEKIEDYLNDWEVEKSVGTLYDKTDIKKSDLLVYVSVWPNGYPQPENVPGYINLTYNTDNYCKDCGIGAVQKEPFRIKKEPKWGEKKIFELNWVFDEVFVRKDIYESVFKVLGIECLPVLLTKKNTVIENTVQLIIPTINKNPLKLQEQLYEKCKSCGEIKYSPQIKGFFPAFKDNVAASLQIFKCAEFFGSGGEAHNKIFITKELLQKLNALKIKPLVWPLAPSRHLA